MPEEPILTCEACGEKSDDLTPWMLLGSAVHYVLAQTCDYADPGVCESCIDDYTLCAECETYHPCDDISTVHVCHGESYICLEFCDAACRFVKTVSIPILLRPSEAWSAFLAYLNENKKEYKVLIDYMIERKVNEEV